MTIREGIGWFTLKLYTSHDDEIQTTDAYIDMSDSVDIDLTTETKHEWLSLYSYKSRWNGSFLVVQLMATIKFFED